MKQALSSDDCCHKLLQAEFNLVVQPARDEHSYFNGASRMLGLHVSAELSTYLAVRSRSQRCFSMMSSRVKFMYASCAARFSTHTGTSGIASMTMSLMTITTCSIPMKSHTVSSAVSCSWTLVKYSPVKQSTPMLVMIEMMDMSCKISIHLPMFS